MNKSVIILLLVLPLGALSQPLIETARRSFADHDWEKARVAYQQITTENPYNALYWYRFGKASLNTSHPGDAVRAYLNTLEKGFTDAGIYYELGSACALTGDKAQALHWLQKAKASGEDPQQMSVDPNLENVRDQPDFNSLVNKGHPPLEDRVDRWRADLAYLKDRVEKVHFRYTHTITKEDWESRIREINAEIPGMTDLEVIGAFMELVAAIGDGHTILYPAFQGPYAFTFIPLEFYFFGEDLFVRGAEAFYKDLVGSRVLKIGKLPVSEVIRESKRFLGRDNEVQLKWILPVAFEFGDIFELTGATDDRQTITLTLENPEGKVSTTTVTAGDISRDPMGRFVPGHWVDMRKEGQALWTKDPDNYYWFEYLIERKIVYCQWNQVRDKPGQSVRAFSRELFEFIDAHEVGALVLDIRLNNGGNNFLNKAFIHELIRNKKVNQRGKLFTIIGRRTFSAAMNLASDLENHSETLFVGEPTASRPNFYGEEAGFVLPYSGLAGSISSRYWQGGQTSDDRRIWIAPHLAADLSAAQYRNNEDPAMEAILGYLDADTKP